jgi:hypothetical protein
MYIRVIEGEMTWKYILFHCLRRISMFLDGLWFFNLHCICLKVLSSEMDPAEISSFDRYLLKIEARAFFEKSAHPPSCESPLKIPRHLVQLLAISILIANSAHSSAALYLLQIAVGARCLYTVMSAVLIHHVCPIPTARWIHDRSGN